MLFFSIHIQFGVSRVLADAVPGAEAQAFTFTITQTQLTHVYASL